MPLWKTTISPFLLFVVLLVVSSLIRMQWGWKHFRNWKAEDGKSRYLVEILVHLWEWRDPRDLKENKEYRCQKGERKWFASYWLPPSFLNKKNPPYSWEWEVSWYEFTWVKKLCNLSWLFTFIYCINNVLQFSYLYQVIIPCMFRHTEINLQWKAYFWPFLKSMI